MEHQAQSSGQVHKRPNYWIVFGVLAVLTLIEIGITMIPGFDPRLPLFLLMAGKVTLVAMYYMHLQSDSRWFAAFFLAPVPFILLIVAALMIRTLR
jgi:heme/copper-type cytochrome/quinol oxidase subunit 4